MSNLDLFIVNVALPSIGTDFGGSLARLSWILNGYAIAFAALLIAAGRLGDRIGQRRVFLAGVAVFTLAPARCARPRRTSAFSSRPGCSRRPGPQR